MMTSSILNVTPSHHFIRQSDKIHGLESVVRSFQNILLNPSVMDLSKYPSDSTLRMNFDLGSKS